MCSPIEGTLWFNPSKGRNLAIMPAPYAQLRTPPRALEGHADGVQQRDRGTPDDGVEEVVPRRVVRNLFHGSLLDVLPEVEEPEEQIHEAVQNQGQWKMLKNRWRKLPKFPENR